MTPPIKLKSPPLPGTPNYSTALYYDPPSHDFLIWLVQAEMNRAATNSPGPLRVKLGLLDGRLGVYDWGPKSLLSYKAWECGRNRAYFTQMWQGVMLPAIEMLGATIEDPINLDKHPRQELEELLEGWVEYDHHVHPLVDACRQGHKPPCFQPPSWAFSEVDHTFKDERLIVITLRETDWQPERNSNLDAWREFARDIVIKGEFTVVFVRDTAKATHYLKTNSVGWRIYPPASYNANIRAALAQRATLNMGASGGGMTWAVFSTTPYLIFKQLMPSLPNWEHGQAAGWRHQAHMEVEDQWPWASPLQRLTWTDDTYHDIHSAFEQIKDEL